MAGHRGPLLPGPPFLTFGRSDENHRKPLRLRLSSLIPLSLPSKSSEMLELRVNHKENPPAAQCSGISTCSLAELLAASTHERTASGKGPPPRALEGHLQYFAVIRQHDLLTPPPAGLKDLSPWLGQRRKANHAHHAAPAKRRCWIHNVDRDDLAAWEWSHCKAKASSSRACLLFVRPSHFDADKPCHMHAEAHGPELRDIN